MIIDICFFRNSQVKGDGGCFPRALALYLFGNEELFLHVRLFVVASAFVSQEHYFNGYRNFQVCTLASLLLQ